MLKCRAYELHELYLVKPVTNWTFHVLFMGRDGAKLPWRSSCDSFNGSSNQIYSKKDGWLQKKLMEAKDARIELSSEVLSGMKIIKLQAWEEPFQKRVSSLREAELSQLLWYYVVAAISNMLFTFTPMAVAVATFAVYIWSGHTLDVASALTALALFNILQFPLTMLPRSM